MFPASEQTFHVAVLNLWHSDISNPAGRTPVGSLLMIRMVLSELASFVQMLHY